MVIYEKYIFCILHFILFCVRDHHYYFVLVTTKKNGVASADDEMRPVIWRWLGDSPSTDHNHHHHSRR